MSFDHPISAQQHTHPGGAHGEEVCGHEPSRGISRRNILAAAAAFSAAAALGLNASPAFADPAASTGERSTDGRGSKASKVDWYRIVPGFVPVLQDPWGRPKGTGFAAANPWNAYTAYLVTVSRQGLRTWRVENMMLTAPRADGSQYAQGSTMWLFEGSRRALLVDTAQNTPETIGVNDLKTVVHFLLGHENDGITVRENPVDFDVAITHNHGDHTGKVFQMTDRTVYYPDLDWRPTATPNWVPVRQDGGTSTHGSGQTINKIDLGGRRIDVVAMYGHTAGSTGYLDAANLLLATGDAIGSGYVWAHFPTATTSLYHDMLENLRKELRPLRGLNLLPAHFYQIKQFGRGKPPVNGKPLDLEYLDDMVDAAEGALDGRILADPYHELGRANVWISGGTARMVYSLANLYPGGPTGGAGNLKQFHGVNIPSHYPMDPFLDAPYDFLKNIKTRLVLIRDSADETSFLVRGSARTVLITSGRAAPRLISYAQHLAGRASVEVVLTGSDAVASGGLDAFAGHRVYLPTVKANAHSRSNLVFLRAGDHIDLGRDIAGRRVKLTVNVLPGVRPDAITVLDPVSRVLFAGDALGTQGARGLTLDATRLAFTTALAQWRTATDGKYDTLYTSHNYEWLTRPGYVDSLQTALASAASASQPVPGYTGYTSGTDELLAWVFAPQ